MGGERPDKLQVFGQAVEIVDATARANFLEDACGDDPQLRSEVEELLDHDERAGSFLATPASGLDATRDMAPVSEKPGTQIGPYKLLQELGEGGFGVVFMAEQTQPVKRRVALKVIKPGMDTQQIIARFEAERQALAMMDHPCIAKVLDAGTTESGRPYFVMELIKGVPVSQYCDEQHLSLRQRLELFVQICQAVQHAHQKGVIHRDLKPSNILIAEYDDKPVPKVIDFGVAKALHHDLTERTMFTQYGQIVGTLEYMSPEQAKLNQLDIDTRSDVYSLGVLLYELLTGSTPLTKERLRSVAYDEMLRLIREEEPEKPSIRLTRSGEALRTISDQRSAEPKKLGTIVRGELDWIVMKALEKDRSRRYETANAFASDVTHHLHDEPVSACPPSALYRWRKVVRQHKGAFATATLVAVVLVCGICVACFFAHVLKNTNTQLQEERILVEAQRNRAEEELARAVAAEQRLQRQTYEYGINLAYDAWNRGNRNEFENLMQDLIAEASNDERRGFEWRYLRAKYQELLDAESVETAAEVLSLSYSPDGRHLVVGCADGTAIVINCNTLKSAVLPDIVNGSLTMLSSRGTYLTAGTSGFGEEAPGLESQYQMWRFPSFEEIAWPEQPSADLAFVTLSPNENLLAGVRPDGVIEIRDVLAGRLVGECRGHQTRPVYLTFSPDGRLLASSASVSDPTVRLWSTAGEILDMKPLPDGYFTSCVFTSDGNSLVVGGDDGGAKLFQVSDEGLQDKGQITAASVYSLACSCDGTLAIGCADQTVRIWNLKEFREIGRLLHTSLVSAVAFSPDGRKLAAGTRDNVVHIWNADLWQGKNAIRGPTPTNFTPSVAVAPSGHVATTELRDDREVFKLWNPETGSERDLWVDEQANIIGAAFSPDGKMAASASEDGTIRLGKVATGELPLTRKAHTGIATSVAFSPDGTTLVSGGDHSDLLFWDISLLLKDLKGYEPQRRAGPFHVAGLAFASDEHLAAAGGSTWNRSGELTVWNVRNAPPELIDRKPYPETIRAVAYSPDGSRLAITYKFSAGIVHVLDAMTLEKVFEFRGHSDKVTTLTFTPDGTRLITGSDDGTVRFWDLDHGRPVGTLRIGGRVRNVKMLPDGDGLLTLSRDGWLRLWRATPQIAHVTVRDYENWMRAEKPRGESSTRREVTAWSRAHQSESRVP